MVDQSSTKANRTSSPHLKINSSVCTSPLYRKEGFLRQKYEVEKLTAREIAFLIGHSHDSVNRTLKRFGITKDPSRRGRPGYEVALTKKERIYEKNRKRVITRMQRLRSQGLSYDKIAKWLEKNGIIPPSGKPKWYGASVRRILIRAKLMT